MNSKIKILGIITARGGSKGIPGKNIKDLCGKPLIAHTIEAAQKSGVFDRIILSTDDEKIANIAKNYGIEVPFIRPAELAQDDTPHLPVLQHTVSWLKENQNYQPDAVMLLQPTAPLRQPQHIKEAIKLFDEKLSDSVVSVSEIPGHYSPYWAVIKDENDYGKLFNGDSIMHRIPRRQSFPTPVYYHNGAIYLFKTRLLFDKNEPNFYGNNVALYPMAEKYSVNIDSPEDWLLAERMVMEL
ncbi:MAG: acylneuraminate cytidylyltransferase family protein [bacterium]|nr:acylneuraminate cytidylyltransferase family protein [bacterium]